MKKTYTYINEIDGTIDELSKSEILKRLNHNFSGSFAGVDEIREFFNTLQIKFKNGACDVYKNVHGSYGFPTRVY